MVDKEEVNVDIIDGSESPPHTLPVTVLPDTLFKYAISVPTSVNVL